MHVKVVLADDHRIVREGLKAILASEPDFEIAGEASNGRETVTLARKIEPDVIVMDVSMPDLNGIDATQRIMDMGLGCRILALSGHAEEQFVKGMLQAGAVGYLLKECAGEELTLALHTVNRGRIYVSPDIASVVVNDYVALLTGDVTAEGPVLSTREREVLQLIAEGGTTAHIAENLNVSVKTVESHRKHIMDKLDIRNVAGLTKYAIREGISSLDS
jgi:two-component system response regulator NreC